jgi:hypothetical protein
MTISSRTSMAEDKGDSDALSLVGLGIPSNSEGLALGHWVGEIWLEERSPCSVGRCGECESRGDQAAGNDEGAHIA